MPCPIRAYTKGAGTGALECGHYDSGPGIRAWGFVTKGCISHVLEESDSLSGSRTATMYIAQNAAGKPAGLCYPGELEAAPRYTQDPTNPCVTTTHPFSRTPTARELPPLPSLI